MPTNTPFKKLQGMILLIIEQSVLCNSHAPPKALSPDSFEPSIRYFIAIATDSYSLVVDLVTW